MGNKYSSFGSEKQTWDRHCLLFDENVRQANLSLIEKCFVNDSKIQLVHEEFHFDGLTYQHWFISDEKGQYFLEFSSHKGLYEARVQINTLPHKLPHAVDKEVVLSEEVKERMKQMLGMSNYSLCLRNCEHVVNYIIFGKWFSDQMAPKGGLEQYFNTYLVATNAMQRVNIFPSNIQPITLTSEKIRDKMYSFIDEQYTATEFHYFLDTDEDNYNILVIGPTGAGKSRLINMLFNAKICESKVSHQSVTKDICFIKGTGALIDLKTNERKHKKIVVTDTIGLCDTEWNDTKVLNLLKGRVSSNFKSINAVFIVFRADRLLKEHVTSIKHMMDWLGYNNGNNYLNFLFVATFSENLGKKERDDLKYQAVLILGLRETKRQENYDSLIYVGFPPEDHLNDKGKEQIRHSWDMLQPLLRLSETSKSLKGYGKIVNENKAWNWRVKIGKLESCTIL